MAEYDYDQFSTYAYVSKAFQSQYSKMQLFLEISF